MKRSRDHDDPRPNGFNLYHSFGIYGSGNIMEEVKEKR